MGAWIVASLFFFGILWAEAVQVEVSHENYASKPDQLGKVRKTRQFGYSYSIYKPGTVADAPADKEEFRPISSPVHSASTLNSHATAFEDRTAKYYDRFPPSQDYGYNDYGSQQTPYSKYEQYQKYTNKVNEDSYGNLQYRNEEDYQSPADSSAESQEKSYYKPSGGFVASKPDRFGKDVDETFEEEGKFLKDLDTYDNYKSTKSFNFEGPHQIETIQSKSYHKKVPYLDVSGFEHKSGHEEKHGEVHYHQHKHVHKHEHKQEHVHKHQQEHKHEHGHKHQHHQEHKHEHHQEHKHEHHQEHKHEHHQEHKHSHKHGHEHKQQHQHKHDHHQEHKHDHHHGHEHKQTHKHKHQHHQEHKHEHHQDHKHEHHQEHKHEHHQEHKHEHKHKHGHKEDHKHKHGHKHDHHHKHGHKQEHHHKHGHKHGHKHSHKHGKH